MPQPSTIHSTFVIERSYPKLPEQVFAAFSDATKKRRWFAGSEEQYIEEFTMDFRVGGSEVLRYRMKEDSPLPGATLSAEGSFEDITPNRRIVTSSTMAVEGRRISASLVTIELLPTEGGTDLICTHQGAFFEGADGPQIREAGWRGLLKRLGETLNA